MSLLRFAARTVFGKLLPKKFYPVIRGPLKGTKFLLGSLEGRGGGGSVYFNLIEPEQTAAFIKTLKPGNIFFDVGANVGYYTMLGAKLVGNTGSVVAIEPSVRNLSCLYRHIVLNKINNVNILPAACADNVSLTAFSLGINTAMGHIIDEKKGAVNNTYFKVTPVTTITLDAVATTLNCVPDVLKIDVEGAELLVLQGAQQKVLKAKPKIFLSIHSPQLRSQCLTFLQSFNYNIQPLGGSIETSMEFFCS